MKKVLIITLYGNKNYGNKLQNYAVQTLIEQKGMVTDTVIPDKPSVDKKDKVMSRIKSVIKMFIPRYVKIKNAEKSRKNNFLLFDNKISTIKKEKVNLDEYNCICIGSDQVWNPDDKMSRQMVEYVNKKIKNKYIFSLSASVGVNSIPENWKAMYEANFNMVNKISVREIEGKEVIKKSTGRNDIDVLIDPTMAIMPSEWDKVSKKPQEIDVLCKNNERYILNYFLGTLSEKRKKEIEKIAKENNCKIINILDCEDPFYVSGPSEFIWLEKNAFLVCTDSFHSSVFAILYKRPFIVYNREDGQEGVNSMNSRIKTLLSKFKLEDRYYKGKIEHEMLKCDYSHVDEILKNERSKLEDFLEETLN